jgi:hypothetical protein
MNRSSRQLPETPISNSRFAALLIQSPIRFVKEKCKATLRPLCSSQQWLMILTSQIGHISHEMESGIKHTQVISGLHLGAYWAANFFVDFLKLEMVTLISIALFHFADLKFYTAPYVYLCFPIAAIPFTYVMAFFFSSVSSAQTGIMFINFGSILFLSNLIFFLRWNDAWEVEADKLHSALKLVLPSFILG